MTPLSCRDSSAMPHDTTAHSSSTCHTSKGGELIQSVAKEEVVPQSLKPRFPTPPQPASLS